MWSLANSKNNEAAKIRWELAPYMNGVLFDIGCGPYKVLPHAVGIDSGHHWGKQYADVVADASNLKIFSGGSADCVFSSHLLEHIPYEDVTATLTEWMRVTKQGGHLILYVPDEAQYPPVGHKHANSDHKWDVNYDKVVAAMEAIPRGWDLCDYQVRNENDEYSLFFVFKMTQGRAHEFGHKLPKPEKTCAVTRYGAIGDMIMVSSILPRLKEQGYHITLYCQSGNGYESVKHDPNVDRFIIQGKDQVPPQFLEEYWNHTKKKYDKWINLCESVEGSMLAIPGRAAWEWPNEARAQVMNQNYLEWTHTLAGVPGPFEPRFFSTVAERTWARRTATNFGKRNILWSLAGSSGHKTWPHMDAVIAGLMLEYPDVHVTLVGDDLCQILEIAWEKEPRVHCKSGKWSIRESMAFAEQADIIIGTETGLLNAAGTMDAWKIVTLSHSSEEMLTKHWKNVIALNQPEGTGCAKHPCRQLHGGNSTSPWLDCPQHDSGASECQAAVGPEMMFAALQRVLGVPVKMQRAA